MILFLGHIFLSLIIPLLSLKTSPQKHNNQNLRKGMKSLHPAYNKCEIINGIFLSCCPLTHPQGHIFMVRILQDSFSVFDILRTEEKELLLVNQVK